MSALASRRHHDQLDGNGRAVHRQQPTLKQTLIAVLRVRRRERSRESSRERYRANRLAAAGGTTPLAIRDWNGSRAAAERWESVTDDGSARGTPRRCQTDPMSTRPECDPALIARLSLSVMRLARVLRQQEPSRSTPAGASVLATIVQQGPITLGDLATAEGVSPSTITKLVSKLEAEGTIERVIDPTDRRVHRVRLSARGRRGIDRYRSRRNAWLSGQLAALGEDDRAKLLSAIDVLERLTAAEGRDPVSSGQETDPAG